MISVLENPAPLKATYLPRTVVDRDDELEALKPIFANHEDTGLGNVFLHGPRGTGKTHLIHLVLDDLPDTVATCYVPCTRWDTQYRVLKQLCRHLTSEPVENGYHTSQLQTRLEQYVRDTQTVIVLDEIDFLLLNDGDTLLYYLSRLDHQRNVGIVAISANHQDLASQLEERTYSTLYPQRIGFEPYTAEQVYRILVERARKSLAEQSLRQEALTYIASTTQNVSLALTWLKTIAETAKDVVTESTVKDADEQAFQRYVDHLLENFSEHHRLLFQGIQELSTEQGTPKIHTGSIYDRYQDLCRTYSEDTLSSRRIGTYLKHLELLNLITAEYHYGGRNGKTREIKLGSHIDGVETDSV